MPLVLVLAMCESNCLATTSSFIRRAKSGLLWSISSKAFCCKIFTSHTVLAWTEQVLLTSITRAISPKKLPFLSRILEALRLLLAGRSSRITSTTPLLMMKSSLPASPL